MIENQAALRDPATIRLRCAAITAAVAEGRSGWFMLDRSRLDDAAERVAALTLQRFPDLNVPYHSRWRHFEAGGVDRKAELDALLAGRSPADVARAHVDLTVVSVLLDAGAGATWRYTEGSGAGAPRFSRSEGLGVASFRAFVEGVFSDERSDPLRADGLALARIDADVLRRVFQVDGGNPMVGLEGRAGLLQRLARTGPRPGALFDKLSADGSRSSVSAGELLAEVLRRFSRVWPQYGRGLAQPTGDVWPHRFAGHATAAGRDDTTEGWVPFHKLSQWLAYSLLEPLQWAGLQVTDLDALTGLPEYRNGGLLLDSGVLRLRNPRDALRRWTPGDDLVVEWRALTVTLLDELAERVRRRLGRSAAELPLACVLEGGTWAAGRQIAAEMREGGAPPLLIESDGTVF